MTPTDAKIWLIGCGGIGGWIAAALGRTLKGGSLTLIDADTVEEHNLDRQLFTTQDIGRSKASVMLKMVGRTVPESVHLAQMPHWFPDPAVDWGSAPDAIFVAVDNHAARKEVLNYLDVNPGTRGFLAANGLLDAEAYFYEASMKDTPADPRIMFPEILTDNSENRLAPPCTGEQQVRFPQLAVANMLAASYAMYLWWHHLMVLPSLKDSGIRAACAIGRVYNTGSRVASATVLPR
jgi:hypothetical protein